MEDVDDGEMDRWMPSMVPTWRSEFARCNHSMPPVTAISTSRDFYFGWELTQHTRTAMAAPHWNWPTAEIHQAGWTSVVIYS